MTTFQHRPFTPHNNFQRHAQHNHTPQKHTPQNGAVRNFHTPQHQPHYQQQQQHHNQQRSHTPAPRPTTPSLNGYHKANGSTHSAPSTSSKPFTPSTPSTSHSNGITHAFTPRTPSSDSKNVDELLSIQTELLHRSIEFVSAVRAENGQPKSSVQLQAKVRGASNGNGTTNGTAGTGSAAHGTTVVNGIAVQHTHPVKTMLKDPNAFLYPKFYFFHPSQVVGMMGWKSIRPIGSGLSNLGNTCFLNATLQALIYTPPLNNYCSSQAHSKNCKLLNQFCLLCELEKCIAQCNKREQRAIAPVGIARNIRAISKTFRPGRQEDSHEFLRFVMDSLQKSALACYHINMNGPGTHPNQKLDHRTKETTVIYSIFGGYFRSQVQCQSCKYCSNTYDPFLDVSLEVEHVNSVTRALQSFTKPETLDADNLYRCAQCKKRVVATKQLTIFKAPAILCIHLKRFQYSGGFGGSFFGGGYGGGKINKAITFEPTLDLSHFMSEKGHGGNHQYSLYAIVVHAGGSANSGHYYSFVKSSNQQWYCMDDSSVQQVSLDTVLQQKAYMLFYSKQQLDKGPAGVTAPSPAVGPVKAPPLSPKQFSLNSPATQPSRTLALNGTTAVPKVTMNSNGVALLKKEQPAAAPAEKVASNGAVTANGTITEPLRKVPKKNNGSDVKSTVNGVDLGEVIERPEEARKPAIGNSQSSSSSATPDTPRRIPTSISIPSTPTTTNGTSIPQKRSITYTMASPVAGKSMPVLRPFTSMYNSVASFTASTAPPKKKLKTINEQPVQQNGTTKRGLVDYSDSSSSSDTDSDDSNTQYSAQISPLPAPASSTAATTATTAKSTPSTPIKSESAPQTGVKRTANGTPKPPAATAAAPASSALATSNATPTTSTARPSVQSAQPPSRAAAQPIIPFTPAALKADSNTLYGSAVSSWDTDDGSTASQLNDAKRAQQQVIAELNSSVKHRARDEWDAELDRGHVKKVKAAGMANELPGAASGQRFFGNNLFQDVASEKLHLKEMRKSGQMSEEEYQERMSYLDSRADHQRSSASHSHHRDSNRDARDSRDGRSRDHRSHSNHRSHSHKHHHKRDRDGERDGGRDRHSHHRSHSHKHHHRRDHSRDRHHH